MKAEAARACHSLGVRLSQSQSNQWVWEWSVASGWWPEEVWEEHFRTRAEMLVSAIQNAKHSHFLTFK
jgi:hypothetical protein